MLVLPETVTRLQMWNQTCGGPFVIIVVVVLSEEAMRA